MYGGMDASHWCRVYKKIRIKGAPVIEVKATADIVGSKAAPILIRRPGDVARRFFRVGVAVVLVQVTLALLFSPSTCNSPRSWRVDQ
jgi:hypothetical protein